MAPYQYPTPHEAPIAHDRFPDGGFGRHHNEWGRHLAGRGIPGAETVPGVASVFRRGPTGNGVTLVMSTPQPGGTFHEVEGDLPPDYQVRLA